MLSNKIPDDLPCSQLTETERDNPFIVIHDLFNYASLPQLRQMHWEFLKAALAGCWQEPTQHELHNLVFFFEKVDRLFESAYLICQQKQTPV